MTNHGCWSQVPLKHPWLPLSDTSCGYDQRLVDPNCVGCHRAREEDALAQLQTLTQGYSEDGYEKC